VVAKLGAQFSSVPGHHIISGILYGKGSAGNVCSGAVMLQVANR
jgi:hypothetical protein